MTPHGDTALTPSGAAKEEKKIKKVLVLVLIKSNLSNSGIFSIPPKNMQIPSSAVRSPFARQPETKRNETEKKKEIPDLHESERGPLRLAGRKIYPYPCPCLSHRMFCSCNSCVRDTYSCITSFHSFPYIRVSYTVLHYQSPPLTAFDTRPVTSWLSIDKQGGETIFSSSHLPSAEDVCMYVCVTYIQTSSYY